MAVNDWMVWRGTRTDEDAQRRELGLANANAPAPRRIANQGALEIQAYDEVCFPGLAAEWARWDGKRPFVGALALELATPADDEVLSWIAAGTPPICFGFGMVGLTVAKREDLVAAAQAAGLVRHESPATSGSQGGQTEVVVDTSAIIDGRIADIVDSGFLFHKLVIPHFVLDELQRIADSSDAQRRGRGRRGLEILARLQKEGPTPVEIVTDDPVEAGDVDSKLVALARLRGAAILTNDFNLNRVADLQSIRVLNINSLANALKPALLPGDSLRIKVMTEGKEQGQGVGYLDDGTMVVIEGGARFVDAELEVMVTRVLQTVMGRMVFAQMHQE